MMNEEVNRQEQLENLLDQLVKNLSLDDTNLTDFTKRLCDIYSDISFRHSYSKISLVLETFRPDERDALSQHIQNINNHAKEMVVSAYSTEQQANILAKIPKLCDHIDLECLRLARIDKVEHIGRTASNELSAADGKLKETEDRAQALDNRVTHYQEQSIAILGIFAGLVVTFSGVIQFTSSSLTNLSEVSTLKITYFVCLSLFFLFNIVFLLMYCISKISGSSIAANCKHRYCENCQSCRSVFHKLIKKYPYVFWFNLIGVGFCAILCFICSR